MAARARALAIALRERSRTKFVVEYLVGPQAWTPLFVSVAAENFAAAEQQFLSMHRRAIIVTIYAQVPGYKPLDN